MKEKFLLTLFVKCVKINYTRIVQYAKNEKCDLTQYVQ